jgi:23S rRNA pseudouridine1911/1915/1917 synthase
MVETDQHAELIPAAGELFELVVPPGSNGRRLDHFLVEMLPDLSRNRIISLIRAGFIQVNDGTSKASAKLKSGDLIEVTLPEPEPLDIKPQKVDFQVLYEDTDILVVGKPPGVVVHPASGHKDGTLVHGLLAHCEDLSGISGVERPGIVHRLDKDTSGVMVIAKNDRSHLGLVELFKSRQVHKVYRALVVGSPDTRNGCISKPIGRHKSNRKKMAVLEHGGREAVTRWSVLEELGQNISYVEVRPETGRTHQIRIHMAFSGHPVVGDALYGGKQQRLPVAVKRQCLHAYSLSFRHPVTEEPLEFISQVWPDMQEVLECLRKHKDS